jgi:hypothetical protein
MAMGAKYRKIFYKSGQKPNYNIGIDKNLNWL